MERIQGHREEKIIKTSLTFDSSEPWIFCVRFRFKNELHNVLRPGHVPRKQLMKVIFLVFLRLSTVVNVRRFGWNTLT